MEFGDMRMCSAKGTPPACCSTDQPSLCAPTQGSLPAELGELTELEEFSVSRNQLTGMMSVLWLSCLLQH